MANCLLVKLPDAVADSEFPRLGQLRIHMKKNTLGIVFSVAVASSVQAVATVEGSYFTSEDGTADLGQEIRIPANTVTTIYVANNDADIFIEKKQIYHFGPFASGARETYSVDLNDLKNIETRMLISINNTDNAYGDIENLPANLYFIDGTSCGIAGDISGLNLQNLTRFNMGYTNINGDIACFANSPSLAHLVLRNTKVTGNLSALSALNLQTLDISDTDIVANLSDVANMTNMISLAISKNTTGDLSSISGLTLLSGSLDIHNGNGITGDLSDVSSMTGLTFLYFSGQKITGDLSSISGLVNATNISLGSCECEGNVSNLADMPNLIFFSCAGENNAMTGNLAALPDSLAMFTAGSNSEFVWSGTRSSSAKIISMRGVRLGEYVDAMLNNQANCVATATKEMRVYGERTSASDSAVATLNSKGYTVFVNDAEVIV